MRQVRTRAAHELKRGDLIVRPSGDKWRVAVVGKVAAGYVVVHCEREWCSVRDRSRTLRFAETTLVRVVAEG